MSVDGGPHATRLDMRDKRTLRASNTDTQDRSETFAEPPAPVGNEATTPSDDDTHSLPNLVGIDQMTMQSIDADQFSDVANVSTATTHVTDSVAKAAFLVTHWLVGEGER
jgi:hypothetical protein